MARKVYLSKEQFDSDNTEFNIPYSDDVGILKEKLTVSGKEISNRLVCQAMEGCDGKSDGSPDELTFRRYKRLAESGAGLIWFEATACLEEGRANPRQLCLREENIDSFKRIVFEIKENSLKKNGKEAVVIMQNTHSGRYSKPDGKPSPLIAYNNPIFEGDKPIDKSRIMTDFDIDRVSEALVNNSRLAETAGFDGVDIKCCHRYLNSELLSAYTREGKYGGSFENRTRLLREAIENSQKVTSASFIVSSRLNIYDGFPYPYGFGVKPDGSTDVSLEEPILLIKELNKLGVELLNITMGNPYFNPHVNRPFAIGAYQPEEHPLFGVKRMLDSIAEVKKNVPEMKLICSALSYLGTVAPNVAAAYIKNGGFDFAGFGRTIFAYPDFANDILKDGKMHKEKVCICCSKCSEIMRAGSVTGCVVRDKEIYLPLYKEYSERK